MFESFSEYSKCLKHFGGENTPLFFFSRYSKNCVIASEDQKSVFKSFYNYYNSFLKIFHFSEKYTFTRNFEYRYKDHFINNDILILISSI